MKPFTLVQTVILFCSFLLLQCSDLAPIAGATDMPNETASVSAVIHDSAGTPVRYAAVIMARAEYLAPLPQTTGSSNRGIFLTMTDESGHFVVDSLDSGSYMIEVNNGSSSACRIHCTIGNDTGIIKLGTFAVQPYAAIIGKIDTMGMPDAQRYIQIYGLNRIVPIESNGFFSIGGLPADLFTIRIVSINTAVKPIDISDIRLRPGETKNLYAPWVQSMKINLNTTLSGAGVSGNVYDFPVLVRLNATNFNFSSVQIDGRDIRFTKPDNTMLPYEIERWDPVAGLSEVWVKVDTVYGNDSSQHFIMFWGNPNAADESNGAAVFDTGNGFQGVWHLSGSGNAIAFDATFNVFDGTPIGISSAATSAGIIGQARTFDGVSNALTMPNTAAGKLDFKENDTYSISLWVYADTIDTLWHAIAGKGHEHYYIQYKCFGNNKAKWEFVEYHDKRGWEVVDDSTAPGPKQWLYLVGVRSGDSQKLYINGVLASEAKWTMPGPYDRNTGDNFSFGRYERPDSIPNYQGWSYFKGKIDEARVASVATTPDWIKLCYMNQKERDALLKW